jgi:hypothetical protein
MLIEHLVAKQDSELLPQVVTEAILCRIVKIGLSASRVGAVQYLGVSA